MPAPDRRAIVVCIGNELIADDAAGFEVFKRLGYLKARLEYCAVGGIDILPLLDGESDMIVVDAVQLGAAPGTVHVLPWDDLPQNSTAISAHGLGLRETIEIGRMLFPEKMPERITLVGIEGRCFNLPRDNMTAEVVAAIDPAVATVEKLVQGGNNGKNCL
jgi:hydrogenase maturation protease